MGRSIIERKSPVKISGVSLKGAVGFVSYGDGGLFVVAAGDYVPGKAKVRPLRDIEKAYVYGNAFRYITWLDPSRGGIVKHGASRVTFDYGTRKVVITSR